MYKSIINVNFHCSAGWMQTQDGNLELMFPKSTTPRVRIISHLRTSGERKNTTHKQAL